MEARGAAAHQRAVAAAERAGGRRILGWAGWAELPSDMGRLHRDGARTTGRNGLQKSFSDLNQGFELKNQGFKYF
jgi:hypothetical protein